MLKKLIFWSPLFIIATIAGDMIAHYGDFDYQWMSICAALGWLFYWDALNDLEKAQADLEGKQDV